MSIRIISLRHTHKVLPFLILIIAPPHAEGACDLGAQNENGVSICDSGTSGAFTGLVGNHTLIFPAGGTGTVTGNVVYGPGIDSVDMQSGRIQGNVTQAAGVDRFTLSSGEISGDLNQGNDPDDFVMSGGTLGSLAQGDGLDTFLLTGGTITRAFEDGDRAVMTGGTIGRVDMKLDNNIFEMSGGSIINNLVTGFGRDTITLTGGSIGGAVSVSGGDDQITVSGGEIRGGIRASFGNDSFNWLNGGYVRSTVAMAEGNDTARLDNLNESFLSASSLIDGGPGDDVLTFDNTRSSHPERYANWEAVNLNNGAQLNLAGTLVLGDSVSNTGVLNVGPGSALTSVSGSVVPFNSTSRATLNNAGTLDLSGSPVTNTLTIRGDYIGQDGRLLLRSVLGDENSPSDRMVVAQGHIGGGDHHERQQRRGLGRADSGQRHRGGRGQRGGNQ